MKNLILSLFLLFVAACASAQVTVEIGKGAPSYSPPWLHGGPINRTYDPSIPVGEYGPLLRTPKYQRKSFWLPGGICQIFRTRTNADVVTFITTVPEHLKASTVELCLGELAKVNFEEEYPDSNSILVDSLKEARTENLACAIVSPTQEPRFYQIKFSAFALTGKDREIQNCISQAMKSPDKIPPTQEGRQTSL